MNLTILLGHRGVGKTSLLDRIPTYIPNAQCFCLDREIEKRGGPIQDIFLQQGENAFRSLEIKVLAQILLQIQSQNHPVFIAVGGGFLGELPNHARILWVKRDWDVSQNIFLDRPYLSKDPSDLKIPREIFLKREQIWQGQGYDELTLPEGIYSSHPGEEGFFLQREASGAVTVLAEHFVKDRWQRLIDFKPRWIELRDDLLSQKQIEAAVEYFPRKNLILSFRDESLQASSFRFVNRVDLVDWPLENGEPPALLSEAQRVFSYHSDEDSFYDSLELLEGIHEPLKWSPFIKNFLQLRLGHEWMMRSPQKRSFLPRSENGRWYWYRHLQKNSCPLSFWREGFGSSLDQPTLLQWLQPAGLQKFAAVLGNPTLQSWSPAFHADFFSKRGMSLYSIEVSEEDLREGGFEFLQSLGMCAAAVTSPFKTWAGGLVGASQPLNTIYKTKSQWQGCSTDGVGFTETLKSLPLDLRRQTIAVWGGGGVLPSLNLPGAHFFSARTGKLRVDDSGMKKTAVEINAIEKNITLEKIDILIWAAGTQSPETLPPSWSPRWVIDMNYRADSPMRAYSHRLKAKYISGETMFVTQAREQQKIWSQYEWN